MYYPIFISNKDNQESGWYIAKKINEDEYEIERSFGRFDSREAVYLFIEALIEAKEKSVFSDDF